MHAKQHAVLVQRLQIFFGRHIARRPVGRALDQWRLARIYVRVRIDQWPVARCWYPAHVFTALLALSSDPHEAPVTVTAPVRELLPASSQRATFRRGYAPASNALIDDGGHPLVGFFKSAPRVCL